MSLKNNGEFCEMHENETQIVSGGSVADSTIVDVAVKFLVNRFVWTVAKVSYDNFYTPVYPRGTEVEPPIA